MAAVDILTVRVSAQPGRHSLLKRGQGARLAKKDAIEVEGTVIEVSPDAQVNKDSQSFYKVTIAPQKTEIAARGKNIPLRTGLTLTAEIVTERKSILSFILEPFRKLRSR